MIPASLTDFVLHFCRRADTYAYLLAIVALGVSMAAPAAAAKSWTSKLYPKVDGKYQMQTVSFAGRDWRLDDFSYAGYYLGTKGLGAVPASVIAITGSGDITSELQAAIDSTGKAGGGVVRIPAGTFTISGSLAIPYNNVSIEGAGNGQTTIQIPSNYPSQDPQSFDAVFSFGKQRGSTNRAWFKAPAVTSVSSVVHRGDVDIDTADASSINAGDWIVLQQFFWQAFVDENSSDPQKWVADNAPEFAFTYLRQVVGKNGNCLTVDAPVPWTLDPKNNPISVRLTDGKMKENVGLKGVTIQFDNNKDETTGRPHGTAVYFEGVRNGWAYDVTVRNFPRNAIYIRWSARVTVLDCSVQGTQDYGGGGYGYGFLVDDSQNVLIRRCHGEDCRHNFLSTRAMTSTLVYSHCVSVNSTEPDDSHFAIVQGVLWDRHSQQKGVRLQAVNRGDESGGAYETLGSGVIWNLVGDGVKGRQSADGAVYLKPSPSGDAIIIGLTGAHKVYDSAQGNVKPFIPGEQMNSAAGMQVASQDTSLHTVLYEGLYQGSLDPVSLYDAQLKNRIGTPPADWSDASGGSAASATN